MPPRKKKSLSSSGGLTTKRPVRGYRRKDGRRVRGYLRKVSFRVAIPKTRRGIYEKWKKFIEPIPKRGKRLIHIEIYAEKTEGFGRHYPKRINRILPLGNLTRAEVSRLDFGDYQRRFEASGHGRVYKLIRVKRAWAQTTFSAQKVQLKRAKKKRERLLERNKRLKEQIREQNRLRDKLRAQKFEIEKLKKLLRKRGKK